MTPAVLVAVATIEAITEIIFGLRSDTGTWNTKSLTGIGVGILVAMLIPSFDVYALAGISVFPPIMGRILTGILASRGAAWFHDFLKLMQNAKDALKSAAR